MGVSFHICGQLSCIIYTAHTHTYTHARKIYTTGNEIIMPKPFMKAPTGTSNTTAFIM